MIAGCYSYTWNRIQTQLGENHERRNETSCQIETGKTELSTNDSIVSDLDRQSGTPPVARTEAEANSNSGGIGEKSDSGRAATTSIGKPSISDSEPARKAISASIQPSETDRNKHAADESNFGGASGDSANLSTGSQRTQERNLVSSDREHDTQPRTLRNQNSKSASDRASESSESRAAETGRSPNRIGKPTPSTDPNQTRMGQDLRLPDDVRALDRLHSGSDAAISASSDQSASPTAAKHPAKVILKWENYCDRINELNPVKRDEKVVRLAILDGKQQKLSSRGIRQAVNQLLQQSPYVQWMRKMQGDEKTNAYVKLTIQAAYQPERNDRKQRSHQRQRSRQRSR